MAVSEIKEALGNFSLKLKPNIPRDVLDKVEYFGHIAIVPGRMDPRTYGDATLDSARYVGVLRKKKISDNGRVSSDTAKTSVTLEGVGMNFWLGDEEDKGDVIENEIQLTSVNFETAIQALLPPAVTMGTVGGVSGTYSGVHQWQTPRKAIQYVCDTMSQAPTPINLVSSDNSSFESTAGVSGWTGSSNCAVWESPQLRSTGTYVAGTGNVTPGLPSGYQADDIFILYVEFDSTDNPSFSISGWTQIGTTIRTSTASGTGTGFAMFWKRATSSETAPNVPDTGNHTSAFIQAFKGCKTSGSPINTSSQTWNDSAGTSVVFNNVTTTVNNCAVIYAGTHGFDTDTAQFSSWSGASEIANFSTSQGSGGGIGVAVTSKVTAGLTGSVSATLLSSSSRTEMTVALEPAQVASSSYSYLGTKSMAVVSNTAGTLTAKNNGSSHAVNVSQGEAYTAYFWVLTTGSTCFARVGVDWRDGSYTQQGSAADDNWLALPQNAWTQVSREITVPNGLSINRADFLLNFQSSSPGDKFYVDEVHFFESPESTQVSFQVDNRARLNAGPESDLFVTDPQCILVRQGSLQGEDLRIKAVPGSIGLDQDMEDFATRLVVLAGSDGLQFSVGESDIGTVSPGTNKYKDLYGHPLKLTKMVSESQTTEENADTRATLGLKEVLNPHREVTLSAEDYDVFGSFSMGDYIYVYDPDSGLVDTANEVYVRGTRLNPIKLQVTELEWPVTTDYSVGYRTADGEWLDLTDYIEPETSGSTKVVIGDFQRTLDNNLQSVQSRLGTNIAPDTSTPGAPTWVEASFQTTNYADGHGLPKARQKLVWTQPLNEDGSNIQDGSHYEIQYQLDTDSVYSQTWSSASTYTWDELGTWNEPVEPDDSVWQTVIVPWSETTTIINELPVGTQFDARIRAVDTSNNFGPWSNITTFITSEDNIPPSTPAPPVVAGNPISIQVIHELGLASGGTFNLELDLAYLEVHYSSDNGFFPTPSTLVGRLRADKGMLAAQTAAVGSFTIPETNQVYVKVVAVDRGGNRSNPSTAATVTADLLDSQYISELTASKITAGTLGANIILSAAIKTAEEGQRVELNQSGFQAYDADGELSINLSSDPSGGDYMSLRGTDGNPVATISSQGVATFDTVYANTEIYHKGTDLTSILDSLPRGVVAWGPVNAGGRAVTNGEVGIGEIVFTAEEGRMYKYTVYPFLVEGNSDNMTVGLLMRNSINETPTTSSLLMGYHYNKHAGTTAYTTLEWSRMMRCGPGMELEPGIHHFLSCLYASGGTATIFSSNPFNWVYMSVEDVGSIKLDTAYDNLGDGSSGADGGDGATQAVTKIYSGTGTGSYRSDGSRRFLNDLMYQGYYSSNHGNQRSLVLFDYAQIQADLSGATILKTEVTLQNYHWYHDYGGTALIGTHNNGNIPSTWPSSGLDTSISTITNWAYGATRTVQVSNDIATAIASGTAKGITLGPAPNTNSIYYGYFNGSPTATKLKITYTKSTG